MHFFLQIDILVVTNMLNRHEKTPQNTCNVAKDRVFTHFKNIAFFGIFENHQ